MYAGTQRHTKQFAIIRAPDGVHADSQTTVRQQRGRKSSTLKLLHHLSSCSPERSTTSTLVHWILLFGDNVLITMLSTIKNAALNDICMCLCVCVCVWGCDQKMSPFAPFCWKTRADNYAHPYCCFINMRFVSFWMLLVRIRLWVPIKWCFQPPLFPKSIEPLLWQAQVKGLATHCLCMLLKSLYWVWRPENTAPCMEMIYFEAHSVFVFSPASMHGSLLHSPGNFDGSSHLHRLDDGT